MMAGVKGSPDGTRRYDSPVRRAQARETERRILEAAQALFVEQGYVATSLAVVAERAGVNARTVYKVAGTKVGLLSRLVDVAMVGDQEPIPVAERPWASAAFHGATATGRVRAYARASRRVMESAELAFRIAWQAAAVDPEARALWETGRQYRRRDASAFVTGLRAGKMLRDGVRESDAIVTVWLVTAPETFIQLSDGAGWNPGRYERWLRETLATALLDP